MTSTRRRFTTPETTTSTTAETRPAATSTASGHPGRRAPESAMTPIQLFERFPAFASTFHQLAANYRGELVIANHYASTDDYELTFLAFGRRGVRLFARTDLDMTPDGSAQVSLRLA